MVVTCSVSWSVTWFATWIVYLVVEVEDGTAQLCDRVRKALQLVHRNLGAGLASQATGCGYFGRGVCLVVCFEGKRNPFQGSLTLRHTQFDSCRLQYLFAVGMKHASRSGV